MATVNFSVPDDVKQEFNRLFADENKSALLTRLMKEAIEEHKKSQRRTAAINQILKIRETLPVVSAEAIESARLEGRS